MSISSLVLGETGVKLEGPDLWADAAVLACHCASPAMFDALFEAAPTTTTSLLRVLPSVSGWQTLFSLHEAASPQLQSVIASIAASQLQEDERSMPEVSQLCVAAPSEERRCGRALTTEIFGDSSPRNRKKYRQLVARLSGCLDLATSPTAKKQRKGYASIEAAEIVNSILNRPYTVDVEDVERRWASMRRPSRTYVPLLDLSGSMHTHKHVAIAAAILAAETTNDMVLTFEGRLKLQGSIVDKVHQLSDVRRVGDTNIEAALAQVKDHPLLCITDAPLQTTAPNLVCWNLDDDDNEERPGYFASPGAFDRVFHNAPINLHDPKYSPLRRALDASDEAPFDAYSFPVAVTPAGAAPRFF